MLHAEPLVRTRQQQAELQQAVHAIPAGDGAYQDDNIDMSALRHELLRVEAADWLMYIDKVFGPTH